MWLPIFRRISSAPSIVVQTRCVPPEGSGSMALMETWLVTHCARTCASDSFRFIARLIAVCTRRESPNAGLRSERSHNPLRNLERGRGGAGRRLRFDRGCAPHCEGGHFSAARPKQTQHFEGTGGFGRSSVAAPLNVPLYSKKICNFIMHYHEVKFIISKH